MKVFQIEDGMCYWDATNQFPTISSTIGSFPSDVTFVEAPDFVFEGWGYNAEETGDERFIKPTPPDGWFYDEKTGTFSTQNPLDVYKQQAIDSSKLMLEEYLSTHPITWTDGRQYSITRDKQQQLTSKILSATISQQTSTPYTLTWNSTGAECTTWELSDLMALAFAIDARVTALVSYQQAQEIAINAAQTQEELDAIVVDYDTVEASQ